MNYCLQIIGNKCKINIINIIINDMHPHNHSNPLYRPNYNNRPQTSYSPFLNKSHTRLSSQTHNYNPHAFNKSNASHSRVEMGQSRASNLTNMMNQPDIFPEDMVFLLKNEQKNINQMKEKIEKEKSKVENDFAVFRTQIDHILQDIKISVQAELDLVYKCYITKYAQLKGEVQQLRMLRKEILANNHAAFSNSIGVHSTSNKNLIQQIEKDAQHMRNFKIYGYLGQLQRQKLQPIIGLSDQLVLIGAVQSSFYRNKQLILKLKEVKNHFGSFIREVFDNLALYVVSPQTSLRNENQQMDYSNIPHEVDPHSSSKFRTLDANHFKPQEKIFNREQKQSAKQSKLRVSSNEQSCVTNWCEDVKLNRIQRIQTDHSDSILCIYFINDQYVATGSKDTTINIYSIEGSNKIRKLRGHQASICCLSTFRNINRDIFLASGSDHGCSSLMLWDVRSWTVGSKIQAHVAAVTGIVDLEDGRHIATGSYDKKITVFSIVKNQIVLSLNNNKTSVTGMVMTADKSKLVTSGLDKTLITWNILRKHGVVEEIVHEKVIYASQLICQLQPSLLRAQIIFCAARDGSLKIINVISGKEQKSLSVSSNSLIELVAIERQLNFNGPILLTCSAKDGGLKLARMDNGTSSTIKLPTNLGIDYGCGIGPKIVISSYSNGLMAIVNQQSGNAEFSIYEMILR